MKLIILASLLLVACESRPPYREASPYKEKTVTQYWTDSAGVKHPYAVKHEFVWRMDGYEER